MTKTISRGFIRRLFTLALTIAILIIAQNIPGAEIASAFEDTEANLADNAEVEAGQKKIVMPPHTLVINEIDYDQPSTDTAEFIELKNVGDSPIDLSKYQLNLINGGNGASYAVIPLSSFSLGAGDYFVVCSNAVTVPNCDQDVSPDSNLIQNGAPDGIALEFIGDGSPTIVDAVSYEGNLSAPYTEGSGMGLEDDPAIDRAGISRYPDGIDTDQNNSDFSLRCTSPGLTNRSENKNCDIATATPTLIPPHTPTNTPAETSTLTPTDTLTPIFTATEAPSATPTNTFTFTPIYTETATPTFTPTESPMPSETPTYTPTNTFTFTPTLTETATFTFTPTNTLTFTPTFTDTPTFTFTPTQTDTPTLTPTALPTNTHTFTPTYTPTATNSATATMSPTKTKTATSTLRPSKTPTNTFIYLHTSTASATKTATKTQAFTPTSTATKTKTTTPTETPNYCPGNLVLNGSFELPQTRKENIPFWTEKPWDGNIARASGYQADGQNEAWIAPFKRLFQDAEVIEGNSYQLLFWAGTHNKRQFQRVAVEFFNSSNRLLDFQVIKIDYDVDLDRVFPRVHQYVINMTAPEGATKIRIVARNGSLGILHFDAVCLRNTSTSAP